MDELILNVKRFLVSLSNYVATPLGVFSKSIFEFKHRPPHENDTFMTLCKHITQIVFTNC